MTTFMRAVLTNTKVAHDQLDVAVLPRQQRVIIKKDY